MRTAVAEINRTLDGRITAETEAEQARELIQAEVRRWMGEQAGYGRYVLSADLERRLVHAVYNERFGLGAIQPLLEDPQIETIDINGADQVWINYADGTKVAGEPVADSDAQLVELIRRWGAYQGQTARDFSPARPRLRLALPDGSRLTAMMSVTPRPCLSIRRHRMLDVSLDELVEHGTLDQGLREFLGAAVRARKDIIQDGPDELDNALALCALHHTLFDLGVLGLTDDHRIRVSDLYVARSPAGQAVHALAGRHLTPPQPGRPTINAAHIAWHTRQVFKGKTAAA